MVVKDLLLADNRKKKKNAENTKPENWKSNGTKCKKIINYLHIG